MINIKNIKLLSLPVVLSLVFALILVISSLNYVTNKPIYKDITPVVSSTPTATLTPTPTPYIPKEDREYTKDWITYTDDVLGFSFKYPKDTHDLNEVELVSTKTFLRLNKYPAPTVLLVLALRSKAEYSYRYGNLKLKPFSVIVFLNPESLSINEWYKKYDYFPYTSGPPYGNSLKWQPELAVTIDSTEARYYVMRDEDAIDKFIFIPKGNHMFFLTSLEETDPDTISNAKIADQILATFKFSK